MSDYIKREDVIEKIKERINNPAIIGWLIDIISSFPAADVAEVRHGKWITPHWCNSTSCANCSECGFEAQHGEYQGVQDYYKLCPSCGAKMDEMEEEK